MPFVLPAKVLSKLPISRFKDVAASDATIDGIPPGTDFILQKRKKAFRHSGKPLYRIVTSAKSDGYRYLIARGHSLESIKNTEWRYIQKELGKVIPTDLDHREKMLWLIAHFTQLALEEQRKAGGDHLEHLTTALEVRPALAARTTPTQSTPKLTTPTTRHTRATSHGSASDHKHKRERTFSHDINTARQHTDEDEDSEKENDEDVTDVMSDEEPIDMGNTLRSRHHRQSSTSELERSLSSHSITSADTTPVKYAAIPTSSKPTSHTSPQKTSVSAPQSPSAAAHAHTHTHTHTPVSTSPPQSDTHYVAGFLLFLSTILITISLDVRVLYLVLLILNVGVIILMTWKRKSAMRWSLKLASFINQQSCGVLPRTIVPSLNINAVSSSSLTAPAPASPATPHQSRMVSGNSPPTSPIHHAQHPLTDALDAKQFGNDEKTTTSSPQLMSTSTSSSPQLMSTSTPLNGGLLKPGLSLQRRTCTEEVNEMPPNSYSDIDASSFKVRIGPNYAKNKKKHDSGPSLLECVAIDMYASEHKVSNVGRAIELPGGMDDEMETKTGVPNTIIINFQVPAYEPAMPMWGTPKDDGRGYSLVFYYVLSPEARASLLSDTPTPALRLLQRFINAEPGSELRARFKAICRLMNVEECGLGGPAKKLVTSYNGTPFLIRTTSVFHRGPHYFEIDVDVHRFSYLARVGLNGIRERIKYVIFDFAFVVQGETDDELPEQILSASRLAKLDLSSSIPFPEKYLK